MVTKSVSKDPEKVGFTRKCEGDTEKMFSGSFSGADLSVTLNQIPLPGLVLVISLV